jgi:hypothetical protein
MCPDDFATGTKEAGTESKGWDGLLVFLMCAAAFSHITNNRGESGNAVSSHANIETIQGILVIRLLLFCDR